LQIASGVDYGAGVPKKSTARRRSGCPVSISLEILGDRWSLLIVRDLMVRGFQYFSDFEEAGEGIATNILSDRLRRLEAANILALESDGLDARRVRYRLTKKGIDLAPVLFELLLWGANHEDSGAPYRAVAAMARNRDAILAEVRRRWKLRDPTPLLPWLGGPPNGPKHALKTGPRRESRSRAPNPIQTSPRSNHANDSLPQLRRHV
jgi:DNA-binding HxlR family transcriptional regulator